MRRSTKTIIGITVAILIVLVGFALLKKPSGTQGASGLEHIIRPLMNGGVPGDGGGG